MRIDFPPPIFKSKPLKREVLIWNPKKGWRKEWKEESIQFPPPLISIEVDIKKDREEE